MKRNLFTTLMLVILLAFGGKEMWGQILTFEFSGLTGSEISAPSNSNDANLTSSTITRGTGLTAAGNGGRFNATNWALTSIANAVTGDKYMEFTITPNGGYQFSVSSIYIQLQRSSTGPRGIALRNSLDSYAANLDQEYAILDNTTTQNFTFTFAQSNSNVAVTYRVYMWAESTAGSGGIGDGTGNDISVAGITSVFGGPPTAATPTFDPAAGTYYATQNVTISTTTPLATIYYTTDGTDPDNTDTEYTVPVAISGTTTLKAIAYATGFDPSSIGTALYTFPTINEVADIATLRAGAADGTVYKLTGEAILTFQQIFRNQKFIQDGTAGVLIDDPSGIFTTSYTVGDGITGIIGTLLLFNGMLEFVPVADPGVATSVGNAIVPIIITATEFLTNFDNYESRVVEIQDLIFADGGGSFANGTIYQVTEAGLTDFNFRTTFFDVDYIGTTIPVKAVNIVGIPNERFGSAYFLTARDAADITRTPVIPLGTSGIILAILLISAALFIRRGKLF